MDDRESVIARSYSPPAIAASICLRLSISRPVRLKTIFTQYKKPVEGKTGLVFSARDLPKTLDEHEAHDEYCEFDKRFLSENVKAISVSDVAGKEWKLSWRQLKKLREDGSKYL